ncbi:hypothetical protein BDV59DRAFT_196994 [Aspergillus ambiguus]|uniref:uncharacterized protein n=1 Tax=Aspergillus ambiguus TaxID=176160 RepID=UPI003CCE2F90
MLQVSYYSVSKDIGELLILLYSLPGLSTENLIDVNTLSNLEIDTGVYSYYLYRLSDIREPIDLNAVSMAVSDVAKLINSLPSLEEYYKCKICYRKVVDLVLSYSYTYCYKYFNKFFYVLVSELLVSRQYLYILLRCPEPQGLHCLINDYMIQGVRLKIL